jgi:hypothetical protein
MGMRYGVFNDGFILGREREEEEVYPIICSGETDMNRFGSPPNHENRRVYD